MGIFQYNSNNNRLSTATSQSLHLQNQLKYLSLPFLELQELAHTLFEHNPAIDSYQHSHLTSGAPFLDNIPQPQKEDFFEQIPTKLLSAPYKILAQEIFSSLDQEGFLQQEEKRHLSQLYGEKMETVLSLMQQYAGLGFENRLFYWAWLLEKKEGNSSVTALLRTHSRELLAGEFETLCKKLALSFEEFRERYLDVLKKLPLAPLVPKAGPFNLQNVDLIIIVEEYDATIEVLDPVPDFCFSQAIHSPCQDVKEFYKPHIEEIKQFLIGMKKRKNTLEQLAKKLVVIQRAYLTGEQSAPIPTKPEQLAEDLNIHPSTLARCLQHKTLLCVHGVISLKSLVSPSPLTENKTILLQSLKNLILHEDKKTPYSDEKLLTLLKAKGSKISRRTLTKYRHQLKIPDARRRFFR